MPHLTKLFNRMLLSRIRAGVEPLLLESQNGFRPRRGTTHHVLALSMMKSPCFIDFCKAFDSVLWVPLEKILRAWCMPEELISAVFAVMRGHNVQVRVGDSLSDKIEVSCGVLQGDTLAPLLFVLAADAALRRLPQELGISLSNRLPGQRCRGQRLCSMAYADDIILMSHSVDHSKHCFQRLKKKRYS